MARYVASTARIKPAKLRIVRAFSMTLRSISGLAQAFLKCKKHAASTTDAKRLLCIGNRWRSQVRSTNIPAGFGTRGRVVRG
jgi:hypothetical protein